MGFSIAVIEGGMSPAVREAIEGVYEAFRDAKAPRVIEACPCCHEEGEYCALTTLPLRELTGEQLGGYAFSVFYTVGGVVDFEYLFPRILELAAVDILSMEGLPTARETVLKKPGLAGWPHDWRKDRRRAFERFLEAVVESFAEEVWANGDDLDSWVCSLSFCVEGLGAKLEVFLRETEAAKRNLILFYEANSEALMKGRLGNAFWERDEGNYKEVLAWFERADVQGRIQEGYGVG